MSDDRLGTAQLNPITPLGNTAGVPEANLPPATPTYSADYIAEAARQAHEINRAYSKGLGDHSHLPWDEAPQWQKDSAIKGVEAVIADPDVTPKQLHESWLGVKLAAGWVYGEVKDEDKKTHPCMLPYEDLPEAQRVKDELFGGTVRRALGMV
jgi:hypothetical protein